MAAPTRCSRYGCPRSLAAVLYASTVRLITVRKLVGIRFRGRRLRVGVPVLSAIVFAVWISAPGTQASTGAGPGDTNVLSLTGAVHARLMLSDQCLAFTLPALAAKQGAETLGISVCAQAGAHQYRLLDVIDEDASSKADAEVASLQRRASTSSSPAVTSKSSTRARCGRPAGGGCGPPANDSRTTGAAI